MQKLRNKKITVNGRTYASKKEFLRHTELILLEKKGIISDLEFQKKFVLIPTQRAEPTETYQRGARKGEWKKGELIEKECAYIADFVYKDSNGNLVVEDVKGYKGGATYELFKIKRKLMLQTYGIKVEEI